MLRKTQSEAAASKAWSSYLEANQDLISDSGLPASVFGGRREFELFLMHSRVAGASYHLEISTLSESERAAVKELVVRYIAEGFDDPGVALFDPSEDHRLVSQGRSRRADAPTSSPSQTLKVAAKRATDE